MKHRLTTTVAIAAAAILSWSQPMQAASDRFEGRFVKGTGDVEYLRLLDASLRVFHEDPELPNISMTFTSEWNGLQLGSGWDAWWIQNTYGPTFCILPFIQEPYLTFIARSNDLWFKWIGDGKTIDRNGAIGPDGCLCDAARPDFTHYRQGDGDWPRHDFAMEMTGAGVVMQGEMLLATRDPEAIAHYLPLMERSVEFVESRRDPENDLFLVGFAGNLLGPSWAGTIYPDGSIDKGYLAGMSVTYIAALDRMIELEKLTGNDDKVKLYEDRRERTRRGLKELVTDEGYFVKGIDLLGVKHGVYGAEKHGYFESNVNHDAVALGVVDLEQSKKIVDKIASIPGLRPYSLIACNYPSLDDQLDGDYGFGNWVNGGHWSTSEARMMLAYYRVGRHADAVASMRQIMKFFDNYLADAPLTDFGNQVWFKDRVVTMVYDAFGVPAGMIRGLFQPVYSADKLTITPSVPDGVTSLEQSVPIRFGKKSIELSVKRANVEKMSATLNGAEWKQVDGGSISFPFAQIPDVCRVEITLPKASPVTPGTNPVVPASSSVILSEAKNPNPGLSETVTTKTDDRFAANEPALKAAEDALKAAEPQPEFEAAFVRSVRNAIADYRTRAARDAAGKYSGLTEEKRKAIIKFYEDTAVDMIKGLDKHLRGLKDSSDPAEAKIGEAYVRAAG